jgi:hypothetical protein
MFRSFKLIGGLIALVIVLVGGLYAYRSLMLYEGRTPEGYQLLTAVPGSLSFEPETLPQDPVLENQSAHDLGLNFGYKVGGIPYSYELNLRFSDSGDQGHATVTVRHATREASAETGAVRRWDEPRKAYAVAIQDKFDMQPAVPSLCIKAVIGPEIKSFDLRNASICVAQRDGTGTCHPETLACGLIR